MEELAFCYRIHAELRREKSMGKLMTAAIGLGLCAAATYIPAASAAPDTVNNMGETVVVPVVTEHGTPTSTTTSITASNWECGNSVIGPICTVSVFFSHNGSDAADTSTINYRLSFPGTENIAATTVPDIGVLYDGDRKGGFATFDISGVSQGSGELILRGDFSGNVLGRWALPN
ncbi:hypothetical protein [Nocardia sp. NPDC058705]|uniref:hypothetical protein n=1 Tax=Nocardia sp. NPDC058705 TaxID=3346609 RepID=UPI0036BF78CD